MSQSKSNAGTLRAPLIVHSHLRWDFVWQRPQQLMTRFACHAPVFFLEEPVFADDVVTPSLRITLPNVNVYRAVPMLPSEFRHDYNASAATVRELARASIENSSSLRSVFANPVQWFYTPLPASTMLGAFNEVGIVYDCMDELSKFRFAPPELVEAESLLMDNADVVFTGGHKLYRAKSRLHDNVHFFGCGVDAAHFGKAQHTTTRIPDDIAKLQGKVAGYYGVIDERVDYELIDALAAGNPDMQVAMIGPTVKVDPASLPARNNLHWFGARDYDQLPAYVKRFDVCLMPFALNEATEYINPTKTLEYMAAGKPIVSTPIADVVHHFSPPVRVAGDTAEFVSAVAADARAHDASRIIAGMEMARSSSWEAIVASMRRLIAEAIEDSADIQREYTHQPDISPAREFGEQGPDSILTELTA